MRAILTMGLMVALFVWASIAFGAMGIRDEQAMTVLVTNEGFLGRGRGSGIVLDETHVLTCAHMADSAEDEFFVYTYPLGVVIKARVEYADLGADLMILKLNTPVTLKRYAEFEHHWIEGQTITVIGNALGSMKWVVSKGVISGAERGYLLTDARINPGNSGGPWFDDDGYVVALTDWGISAKDAPGIAGGVSAAAIERFLEAREQQKQMSAMLSKLLGG